MIIATRGGHCAKVIGAVGVVNEYVEMQKLYPEVAAVLRANGHTVIDCNSNASSQSDDLKYGVDKANAARADIFFSLHMNAFNGSALGTECWTYSSGSAGNLEARRIVKNMASKGFRDRGVKHKGFYELKYTNMAAIIVETCFCDSKTDTDIFKRLGYKAIARLIANGIDPKISISGGDITPPPVSELYRVRLSWSNSGSQKGAFSDLQNAIDCCKQYPGYSVYDSKGVVKFTNGAITAGSTVKIVGTHYVTGQVIPEWVKNGTHKVDRISGDRALIAGINSWVYLKDLRLA